MRMEKPPNKPRLGYRNLEAWKQAVSLAGEIHRLTSGFSPSERDIRSQMNAGAESVSSNIAEAEGRFTNRDALRIYYIARGSLWELGSQINVCAERGLIDYETGRRLEAMTDSVGRLIGGIIRMRRVTEEMLAANRKRRPGATGPNP